MLRSEAQRVARNILKEVGYTDEHSATCKTCGLTNDRITEALVSAAMAELRYCEMMVDTVAAGAKCGGNFDLLAVTDVFLNTIRERKADCEREL